VEFDLIARHFTRATPGAVLGVGDDCALLQPSPGKQLAVTTDLLIAGRHFMPHDGPGSVGHKAAAVNLSDLAAMGATPRWATLQLALPTADDAWLAAFARGLFRVLDQHGCELVGGDTTKGDTLTVGLTVFGEVAPGRALTRGGAQPGDDVWVSGVIGSAALALAYRQGRLFMEQIHAAKVLPALYLPTPRIELGQALIGIATAAIDISDGLVADLGHILERSGGHDSTGPGSIGLGAELDFAAIPVHDIAHEYLHQPAAIEAVLAGGDDYELCFTAPADRRDTVFAAAQQANVTVSRIGFIRTEPGCVVRDAEGNAMTLTKTGYDHFAA